MIKDIFLSFKDNIAERTRNPFLGTYIIVWTVRNWELVFTLLNFDSDQKLKQKVEFIKLYYENYHFFIDLLYNIFWTFGVLVLTYTLINLSRFIVNLFEKQLTPFVYKITDSKSIVLKATYEQLRNERDELQTRLDNERESKAKLEIRIKSLEDELTEKLKEKVAEKQDSKVGSTEKSKRNSPPRESLSNETEILFNKIQDKNLIDNLLGIGKKINKGEPIRNDNKTADYLVELGLIKYQNDWGDSRIKYSITPEGEKVLKKARMRGNSE